MLGTRQYHTVVTICSRILLILPVVTLCTAPTLVPVSPKTKTAGVALVPAYICYGPHTHFLATDTQDRYGCDIQCCWRHTYTRTHTRARARDVLRPNLLVGPLVSIVQQLLQSAELQFYQDHCFMKESGSGLRTAFHQDAPYFPFSASGVEPPWQPRICSRTLVWVASSPPQERGNPPGTYRCGSLLLLLSAALAFC